MLQRLREFLTVVLLALLPFHALFVTAGTKFLLGPGHAPMPMLAMWKEVVLALILIIALLEILRRPRFTIDVIDGIILALLALSIILFLYRPWMTTTGLVLGFKYDFIPLIAFMMLRRVSWSEWFRAQAQNLLLWVGGIVALYGILTLFAPRGFFRLLGYSDAISLYIPSGPIAAFQQISGSALRRMQSTMSGPNQLGLWLLMPWTICVLRLTREKIKVKREKLDRTFLFSLFSIISLALVLTFSRSAWIAAFMISAVIGWKMLPKRIFRDAFIGIASLLAIVAVVASLLAPSIFLRATSTWGHLIRPIQAIHEMIRYPLGMGLGAAGPAANRLHEPCVFLPSGSDPSWAKNSPALCVFVGHMQAQPTDHHCNCALLPENWYLQIGVELGVFGFVLYLSMIARIIWVMREKIKENREKITFLFYLFSFLCFFGISIAALFLHAWEDAAVAYTGWILTSIALQHSTHNS